MKVWVLRTEHNYLLYKKRKDLVDNYDLDMEYKDRGFDYTYFDRADDLGDPIVEFCIKDFEKVTGYKLKVGEYSRVTIKIEDVL